MGRKKEVHKPQSSLHTKILCYVQSMEYTPKPLSWFLCFFNAKLPELRHAMAYLEYYHYIRKNEAENYEVCTDIRLRVRGVFHRTDYGGYVEPDIQRGVWQRIHVPEQWCFGAQHNDRVQVALEGVYQDAPKEVQDGAIEEIVRPFGDYFCGTVRYMEGEWYVIPFETQAGFASRIDFLPRDIESGDMVYARFTDSSGIRDFTQKNSDVRQRKKTIVWKEIQGEINTVYLVEAEKTCCVLCKIHSESEAFAYQHNLHSIFSPEAMAQAEQEPKRRRKTKATTKRDLTHLKSYIVSPDRAHAVVREDDGFRIYSHAADVTEYIPEGSALDIELKDKGCFPNFLPEVIRNACAFRAGETQNALTLEFKVDKDCNLVERTMYFSVIRGTNEKPPFYAEAEAHITMDDVLDPDPLRHATEFTAMDYFEPDDFPAPYTNRYISWNWAKIKPVLDAFGFCTEGEGACAQWQSVLDSAKTFEQQEMAQLMLRYAIVDMPYWQGIGNLDISRVDFCQPFSSYYSILTQRCYLRKSRHLTKEEYHLHCVRMEEETSLFYWQRQKYFHYEIVLRNERKVLQYRKNPGMVVQARVIDAAEGYIWCEDGIGKCSGLNPNAMKPGDYVKVQYFAWDKDRKIIHYRPKELPADEQIRLLEEECV